MYNPYENKNKAHSYIFICKYFHKYYLGTGVFFESAYSQKNH